MNYIEDPFPEPSTALCAFIPVFLGIVFGLLHRQRDPKLSLYVISYLSATFLLTWTLGAAFQVVAKNLAAAFSSLSYLIIILGLLPLVLLRISWHFCPAKPVWLAPRFLSSVLLYLLGIVIFLRLRYEAWENRIEFMPQLAVDEQILLLSRWSLLCFFIITIVQFVGEKVFKLFVVSLQHPEVAELAEDVKELSLPWITTISLFITHQKDRIINYLMRKLNRAKTNPDPKIDESLLDATIDHSRSSTSYLPNGLPPPKIDPPPPAPRKTRLRTRKARRPADDVPPIEESPRKAVVKPLTSWEIKGKAKMSDSSSDSSSSSDNDDTDEIYREEVRKQESTPVSQEVPAVKAKVVHEKVDWNSPFLAELWKKSGPRVPDSIEVEHEMIADTTLALLQFCLPFISVIMACVRPLSTFHLFGHMLHVPLWMFPTFGSIYFIFIFKNVRIHTHWINEAAKPKPTHWVVWLVLTAAILVVTIIVVLLLFPGFFFGSGVRP